MNKKFERQVFGKYEDKGFERILNIVSKFLLILVGIIVVFIIAFNVSDDVWYATHVAVVNILGHEDGLYCIIPHTCVEIINEYTTLYTLQMEYVKNYGVNAPNRPMRLFKYNHDFNAYVRWIYD